MGKLININNLDKLSKALDARYKELINEEKARAIDEEEALQSEIDITKEMFDGKSIKYISQAEYDALTEEERNSDTITYFITDAEDISHEHENKEFLDGLSQEVLDNKVDKEDEGLNTEDKTIVGAINELQSGIQTIESDKADQSYVDEKLEVVDAITLNGYSLWVGTTEELEAITERNHNTLYFEIDDGTDEEVVQVDIVDGVLQLTVDKYQKTTMLDGTEIVFPAVSRFTEIHLYFTTSSNMNIILPDNCKWRVEPNIEEGKSYEIIATYNTIEWLVNVIVYSH